MNNRYNSAIDVHFKKKKAEKEPKTNNLCKFLQACSLIMARVIFSI